MQQLKAKMLDWENVEQKENRYTLMEFVKVDITYEDKVQTPISNILEKFGQIHVLANVVGGYLGGKSVNEVSEDEWDKMMSINPKSAFLVSKHVLSSMKIKQYGKIVNVSSTTGSKAIGNDSAYVSSKSELIRLVESMAEEVSGLRININCVLPTILDTETNRAAMPASNFSTWISVEELANVICFLCSEDYKIINGVPLPTRGTS